EPVRGERERLGHVRAVTRDGFESGRAHEANRAPPPRGQQCTDSFRWVRFFRRIAGQQRHLLAALEQARQRLQPLDLLLELGDVLEAPIYRREAHVRDDVETAQLLHHEIADQPARHFALAHRLQTVGDVLDAALDVLALHWALL